MSSIPHRHSRRQDRAGLPPRFVHRALERAVREGAQGSGDSVIYGGMQDNGSAKVFRTPTTVLDDHGNPINVSSVQVFGGDGGYTLVDPANSNNVITEYTGLTVLKSTDGGANWHFIVPADPDPRFIAPIVMDRTNPSHLVAGGAIVWNSEAGIAGTTSGTGASTDWQNIFDVRNAVGGNSASQVSALDAVTAGGTQRRMAAVSGRSPLPDERGEAAGPPAASAPSAHRLCRSQTTSPPRMRARAWLMPTPRSSRYARS